MRSLPVFNAVLLCCLLPACDQIAELDGSKAAEAEGKATGGACRHAGRALEDCYALNEKAPRSAVFAGWREMNDYMTQNKIDPVLPVEPLPKKAAAKHEEAGAAKQASLPDPLAVRRAGTPADGGKGALAGRVAGSAAVGGAPEGSDRSGERGPTQAATAKRAAMTPQETAAALFAPPDAAGAAASLPAKVLAGRESEKASH